MTFYRGYNSKYGFDSQDSFIWIPDDKDYASQYGNMLKEFEIDFGKLRFADLDTLDDVCNEFNYDYLEAIYNPTEEMAEFIKSQGFNAFTIELGDLSCCCLLNKSLIALNRGCENRF